MDNACVPESLTELEQHFGGTKSFEEFAAECGYIKGEGTYISDNSMSKLFNDNFDVLYKNTDIVETLSNSVSMQDLSSKGGIASLHFKKFTNIGHLDNIRSIRYYSNKTMVKLRVRTINLNKINDNSTVMYIVRALRNR